MSTPHTDTHADSTASETTDTASDHLTTPRPGSAIWSTLAGRSVRGRAEAALAMLDGLLVTTAYALVLLARYDVAVPSQAWIDFRLFVPIGVLVHLVANWISGLYGPVWKHASMREAQQVLAAGLTATISLFTLMLVMPRLIPLSVALLGGLVATFLFGIVRFQSRLFAFRRRIEDTATRVVVVGAGRTAAAIVREIGDDPGHSMDVVALVDDDPTKLRRRLGGRPVEGTIDELVDVARLHMADQLLLAISGAPSALVQRIADAAIELSIPLRVVPGVGELAGAPRLKDVRDLSIDDVLGRQQISTDLDAVRGLLAGRRVLVTGGGGSIGSEIVRQVSQFGPAALGILDIDETHIFDAAALAEGPTEQLLVDVTRSDQVDAAFAAFRPDIVFHAAAKKHVPLLEDHACRAAETNVLGTRNVIVAAREHTVEHLVFVSTDKAVNPANVMGASKRVGEQLVLSSRPDDAAWCAVRFGNVLGSRGSVIPTFIRQIRDGGPVTVTHEDMTRYFMSIPEAVQLVLQSAALSLGGEVFMLDMGEPVRIIDLARRMVTLSGQRPEVDIDIEIVGLRPGEKLTEELHVPAEQPRPTAHPKVTGLLPPLLPSRTLSREMDRLTAAVLRGDDDLARGALFSIATCDEVRAAGDDDVLVFLDDLEATSVA